MPDVGRFIPSGRSILVGLLLIVASGGAYAAARETSIFAVRTLEVSGATPAVRAQVRNALAGELGRSLLEVDGTELAHRLDDLPEVATFRYDRAFPNTLRIVVQREWPVLVLHRGADAFLVSSGGRVLSTLQRPWRSPLPHFWVPSHTDVTVGAILPPDLGGAAAAAVAPLARGGFGLHVHVVLATRKELTLILRSGLEVRLGDPGDARLKLTIAQRILAVTGSGAATAGYVDVSVPARPVLNLNPQVESRG